MDKVTRLTLEDIARAKLQREKDKLTVKEIVVPSLGKSLQFRKPSDDQILDYVEKVSQPDASMKDNVAAFRELIYFCCEELQNPELHAELEVINPVDVVEAFMEANDVIEVGDELASMNSLYKDYDEAVKNS